MSARTYDYNSAAATKAEDFGNRIHKSGDYVGVLTAAYAVKSKKGTDGMELCFKASDGATADYIQLWTHNNEGKELSGLNTLNALMACLRVKSLAPTRAKVKRFLDGQRQDVDSDTYPMLCNRPIGLLLQRAEYYKSDGTVGFKMELVVPFDAETRLTVAEKANKATRPEKLAKLVELVKDKPPQEQKAAAPMSGPAPTGDYSESDFF